MIRRKVLSIGLAMGLVVPASVALAALSPLPANADANCYLTSDATSPDRSGDYIVGVGAMGCWVRVHKGHVYVALQEDKGDGWNIVAKVDQMCSPIPATGSCPPKGSNPLKVKYPMSKCVHNAKYRIKVSGWYVFTQGGTQHTLNPFYTFLQYFC